MLRPDQLPEVQGIVRDLAQRAELPSVPQLYYVPSKILNAFAVGRREDSAIAVTDGLVRSMTMRQLAGILAHETAHIPSGDLRVMALADVLTRVTSSMAMLALAGQTEPRVAVGSGRPDPADPQPAHPLEPHGHMVLMESGFDIRNPTAVAQLDPTIRRK